MHDGLSDKYGNILFVFCGGGCKAVFQAAAATELVRAGLTPSHIMSSSAGTCNAVGFFPLIIYLCLRMAGRAVSLVFRLMDTFEPQHNSFRRLAQAPEILETLSEDESRDIDAELAHPLPIDEAFGLGCETIFFFLNVPKQSLRIEPHPLRDLPELTSLSRLNERYIHYRIKEAQTQANVRGINLHAHAGQARS